MKIGITFDLKDATQPLPANAPDDLFEEFDSPVTVEAIAAVLRGLGHEAIKLGNGPAMLRRLLAEPPDFVFNFAEGTGVSRSREARVPGVLEMLEIPFTGSDPLTLAVTLDKACAKTLVAAAGVAVPLGVVVQPEDSADNVWPYDTWPVLAKPAWEGSSKGIRHRCLVKSARELPQVIEDLRRDYRQPVLVEEFIRGEELTVGIIGNTPPQVIGTMRVVPLHKSEHFIYSLEVKRDYQRQVRYECPAKLPADVNAAVEKAALAAYRALGCRDISRVDFRLRDGVPYFLEVNPLPGLNPETSDLVILARGCGWSYEQLIGRILAAAVQRCNSPSQALPGTELPRGSASLKL
jgi:D-alanine-D-alanine ligase